ncbi:OLC1v1033901C1 [Oldenlandia corymbosa var. corymbosa]|uniref:OLC1v1033901C1 n=1 Tax=Oldenlandia corymbosa var. corymbosa TaxID=529605 RepID=A0AAV1CS96_OLDCO|nr:OLC1v1033901C1 [Oldenlandia corymbosa var. corymbosa]
MATGAAAGDGIFRGVFDGCISGQDLGIQRRPYHKNCSCALHKSKGHCSHSSKYNNVSYPIRRSWSESCLSLMAAANSSPSPSSSPALGQVSAETRRSHLLLCKEEDDCGDD